VEFASMITFFPLLSPLGGIHPFFSQMNDNDTGNKKMFIKGEKERDRRK
jgi:hypothetical protein